MAESASTPREEIRRAKRELEKRQTAYDSYCGPDPQKFIAEIRRAEERLAAARKALRDASPKTPPVPPAKPQRQSQPR
jgi:hypothetical protein